MHQTKPKSRWLYTALLILPLSQALKPKLLGCATLKALLEWGRIFSSNATSQRIVAQTFKDTIHTYPKQLLAHSPMLAKSPVMACTSAPKYTSLSVVTTGKHIVWTRIRLSPARKENCNLHTCFMKQHYKCHSWLNLTSPLLEVYRRADWKETTCISVRLSSTDICTAYPASGFTLGNDNKSVDRTKKFPWKVWMERPTR